MCQYFAYPRTLGRDNSSKQMPNVQLSKWVNMSMHLSRHHWDPTIPMQKITHRTRFLTAFPIHYANSSKHSISIPFRILMARRSVHNQH